MVLVIDDEDSIQKLLNAALERDGYRIVGARDAAEGLIAFEREQPDVILLDVMMPGLDGWRVAEALLEGESTNRIPIIFLTARAEFRDRARGLFGDHRTAWQ